MGRTNKVIQGAEADGQLQGPAETGDVSAAAMFVGQSEEAAGHYPLIEFF